MERRPAQTSSVARSAALVKEVVVVRTAILLSWHGTKVLEFQEPQANKALRVCCEGTEQELGLAGAHLYKISWTPGQQTRVLCRGVSLVSTPPRRRPTLLRYH